MKPFFIGIAGGSATGKTTLARELKKYFGREAEVFYVDNYQKFEGGLPRTHGMENWDHPKSVNWDKMLRDLNSLKNGHSIIVKSREQKELKKVKKLVLRPAKIIIAEGYLLFYKPAVRHLLDFSIFLTAGEKTRVQRRTKFKNAEYIEKILLPMHKKYIEPTKKFADLVLDTEKYSITRAAAKVKKRIYSLCLSNVQEK